MAITAKSVTPKILKNAAIEYGMTGGVHVTGNKIVLRESNIEGVQKEKLLPYPNPPIIFLAISEYLTGSEKIREMFTKIIRQIYFRWK